MRSVWDLRIQDIHVVRNESQVRTEEQVCLWEVIGQQKAL